MATTTLFFHPVVNTNVSAGKEKRGGLEDHPSLNNLNNLGL
jgi:hypothetical protein